MVEREPMNQENTSSTFSLMKRWSQKSTTAKPLALATRAYRTIGSGRAAQAVDTRPRSLPLGMPRELLGDSNPISF